MAKTNNKQCTNGTPIEAIAVNSVPFQPELPWGGTGCPFKCLWAQLQSFLVHSGSNSGSILPHSGPYFILPFICSENKKMVSCKV